jgi:hypothetical protein
LNRNSDNPYGATITISSDTPFNFGALVIGEGISGILIVNGDLQVRT